MIMSDISDMSGGQNFFHVHKGGCDQFLMQSRGNEKKIDYIVACQAHPVRRFIHVLAIAYHINFSQHLFSDTFCTFFGKVVLAVKRI